ncbi:hypothetical protein SteCoe_17633 [Stentor coeruleus]|uniref:WGR domain-containing protein n=1 Tax=Stentor coeruleus TaxID=5963 RepID=A0A1R2BYD1_9CILI|nr:hypothetical protein SteCoe_17633 [Stentor coeruleus]
MDQPLEESLTIQHLTLEETKIPFHNIETPISQIQNISSINQNSPKSNFIPLSENTLSSSHDIQQINHSNPINIISQTPNILQNTVKTNKKTLSKVDIQCPNYENYHIYEEFSKSWNCILNCVNLMGNNNKFYIIQLLETEDKPEKFFLWTRWGRVGSIGNYNFVPFEDIEKAKNMYLKKYNDKVRYGYVELQIFCEGEDIEKKTKCGEDKKID